MTSTDSSPTPPSNEQHASSSDDSLLIPLEELAKEINCEHGAFVAAAEEAGSRGVQCGSLLLSVKDRLDHGEFTLWVKKNLTFSLRTAQRFMEGARELQSLKSDTVSHLTGAAIRGVIADSPSQGSLKDLEKIIDAAGPDAADDLVGPGRLVTRSEAKKLAKMPTASIKEAMKQDSTIAERKKALKRLILQQEELKNAQAGGGAKTVGEPDIGDGDWAPKDNGRQAPAAKKSHALIKRGNATVSVLTVTAEQIRNEIDACVFRLFRAHPDHRLAIIFHLGNLSDRLNEEMD